MSRIGKLLAAGAVTLCLVGASVVDTAHAREVAPSVQALFDGPHHGKAVKATSRATRKQRRHGRSRYAKLPHKRRR